MQQPENRQTGSHTLARRAVASVTTPNSTNHAPVAIAGPSPAEDRSDLATMPKPHTAKSAPPAESARSGSLTVRFFLFVKVFADTRSRIQDADRMETLTLIILSGEKKNKDSATPKNAALNVISLTRLVIPLMYDSLRNVLGMTDTPFVCPYTRLHP